jgi:hypothetical protein
MRKIFGPEREEIAKDWRKTHIEEFRVFMPPIIFRVFISKNTKIKIYRTIILPVVLYVCETWSLTLREEQRLRMFENRVPRRIFGLKRDEVTGEWRRLLRT